MGTPDTIWSMQEDYPVPASGTIEYKNFEVPTNLTEDRWAQAIEVRPGNRSVVHHVIVYLIDPNAGQSGRRRSRRRRTCVVRPKRRRPSGAPSRTIAR